MSLTNLKQLLISSPKPNPHLGKWHLHSINCLNQNPKTKAEHPTFSPLAVLISSIFKAFPESEDFSDSLPPCCSVSLLPPWPHYSVFFIQQQDGYYQHLNMITSFFVLKIFKWLPTIFGIQSKALIGPWLFLNHISHHSHPQSVCSTYISLLIFLKHDKHISTSRPFILSECSFFRYVHDLFLHFIRVFTQRIPPQKALP